MTAVKPGPPPPAAPRLFALYRHEDAKLKATGLVAWGVQFPDGQTVTWWSASNIDVHQLEVFRSSDQVFRVHGHSVRNRMVWLGQAAAPEQLDTAPLWVQVGLYRAAVKQAAGSPADVEHLGHAVRVAELVPDVLRRYEDLAGEYARQSVELEALRAEHAAMQEHLEVLADADDAGRAA